MFLVSITHHSKIRELSDENKNWKQIQTNQTAVGSTSFELWVMKTKWWVMENTKFKQPLRSSDTYWISGGINQPPHLLLAINSSSNTSNDMTHTPASFSTCPLSLYYLISSLQRIIKGQQEAAMWGDILFCQKVMGLSFKQDKSAVPLKFLFTTSYCC